MEEGRTTRLLTAIWGNRQGYIFLPYKDTTPDRVWHEVPGIPYDGGQIPDVNDSRSDRYFCPLVFSEPKRKKEFALPTNLLWADLDPIHPNKCRLKPSIAWESSPGRYQALWFLTSEVAAEDAAAMSKRIAYADGADKGGWDVTQVLRIPGTHNHKYEMAPEVQLLWAKRSAYSVAEILSAYPPVNGQEKSSSQYGQMDLWSQSVPEALIGTATSSLPIGIRRKLSASTSGADRSLELQKLSRDILSFGIEPSVALRIIQRSSWNKFSGRSDEQAQLLKQILDAQVVVVRRKEKAQPKIEEITRMQVHSWASFLQIPTSLQWLVDDVWVDRTVGFISGRSKSYKTWIALDLALSVVSGSAFLGRYPIRRTGPVVLVQEEDPAPVLQDRLRLIGKMKGMLPSHRYDAATQELTIEYPDYPLHVINMQGFTLGSEDKVAQVRELIARVNPVMVILDPLIVMLSGTNADEYKASEISAVLQAVKMWREEFGCAVLIVHHWNKSKQEEGDRGGQQMYGSFAFHAWLESALHVSPVVELDQDKIDTVMVEREFKAAPSGRSLKLRFDIDTREKYTYDVVFEDDKAISPVMQQILDKIGEAGPMSTPELVQATGHARPVIVTSAGRLTRIGMLKFKQGGGRGKSSKYWLPTQEEPS